MDPALVVVSPQLQTAECSTSVELKLTLVWTPAIIGTGASGAPMAPSEMLGTGAYRDLIWIGLRIWLKMVTSSISPLNGSLPWGPAPMRNGSRGSLTENFGAISPGTPST